MITSLTLHKEKNNFTNKLYKYKNGEVTYNFTDGINIITGRNGSGKSVLLKIIKKCCGIQKDSTYPQMIQPLSLMLGLLESKYMSIPEYIKREFKNSEYPMSDINWDGNMVHYLNADHFSSNNAWNRIINNSPNPNAGQNELYSGIEILANMINSYSQGESTIQLLTKLNNLNTNYDQGLSRVNDAWMNASDTFQNWLKSFPSEKGKPTLLIDELDEHLDLDNQSYYWNYINYLTEKWQVIVISHSLFAFKKSNKDVKYINLNPEYFKKVNQLL